MTAGCVRSIKSLRRTNIAHGTIDPPAEKRNLPMRTVSRRMVSRPSSHIRFTSRLTMGNTNRVVKVDRIRPTTARFKKLTMFAHPTYWNSYVKRRMFAM